MDGQAIPSWKSSAKVEISSIKDYFVKKHDWIISIQEKNECILLFVEFHHTKKAELRKVLRLRYDAHFPEERPRETFVNPSDFSQEGLQFWIDDKQKAFKSNHTPPVICLEGTWGFHHVLHKDRPPERAVLTKLLLEIQKCFDNTY